MKNAAFRLMSKQEARAICGSLSYPGKMPGPAYSLPAAHCRLGAFLQQIPGVVCAHCYALRGRYVFPVVKRAMEKRLQSLSHPRWVEALTTLIRRSGEKYFRWHDSGDIQGRWHLEKIVAVCRSLPRVKFWLPTREYQTVEAYRRMGGEIPLNLCIRYSTHLVDGSPPMRYGLPMITVSSHPDKAHSDAYRCPAARHGNMCGRCRACWDAAVNIVDFPLKWSASGRRGIVP
jgi:hypothetical protein